MPYLSLLSFPGLSGLSRQRHAIKKRKYSIPHSHSTYKLISKYFRAVHLDRNGDYLSVASALGQELRGPISISDVINFDFPSIYFKPWGPQHFFVLIIKKNGELHNVRTRFVTNLTVLGSHVKRLKQCHL